MKLLRGDSLEVLQAIPSESVDAIVTDPPYGLEFMGAAWDSFSEVPMKKRSGWDTANSGAGIDLETRRPGGAGVSFHKRRATWRCSGCGKRDGFRNDHECERGARWLHEWVDDAPAEMLAFQNWTRAWAREALRVLKPGGHALVFGGTRTYHRMACGLEDAGFEIRDCVAWLYGTGFPKSMNVSKAIDRRRDDRDEVREVTAWIRERRDAAGISNSDIDDAFGFRGMAGHWTSSKSQPTIPTPEQMPQLLDVLGVDRLEGRVAELVMRLNGRKGQPGDAWFEREKVGEREMIDSRVLRPGFSSETYHGDAAKVKPTRVVDVTLPASAAAREWEGWGTTLKPGHEPVVVARKPMAGTVVENVLEHRTGALNIDACRVGSADEKGWPASRAYHGGSFGQSRGTGETQDVVESEQGRFPANVILGHSLGCEYLGRKRVKGSNFAGHHEGMKNHVFGDYGDRPRPPAGYAADDGFEEVDAWECAEGCPVRVLDEQSGDGVSRKGKPRASAKPGDGWGMTHTGAEYQDRGGASRFFYCPKPSKREKDAGLAHLASGQPIGKDKWTERDRRRDEDGGETRKPGKNVHPTVKPIALMRWLCRLVTPPGGTVLDPFMGSGTTGAAAVLEGFEFVGIEREENFFEIARARVAHARASRNSDLLR